MSKQLGWLRNFSRIQKFNSLPVAYLDLCVGMEGSEESSQQEGHEDLGEVEGEDPAGDALDPGGGLAGDTPEALAETQPAAVPLDLLPQLERTVEVPQGLGGGHGQVEAEHVQV